MRAKGSIALVAREWRLANDITEMVSYGSFTGEEDIAVTADKVWPSLMAKHMLLEGLLATNIDSAFVAKILYPFVLSPHMRLKSFDA